MRRRTFLTGAEEHFVAGEAFLSDRGLHRYSVAARTFAYAAWNAWITGRANEARARMSRVVATIEDDAYARALLQVMSSYLHVMLQEPEQAAVLSTQAIAHTAERGFRQIGWWVRMSLDWAQAQLGHPDEGASLIDETWTTYRATGSLSWVPICLTWLAEARALGGAPAESLRTGGGSGNRWCQPSRAAEPSHQPALGL